MIYTYSCIVHLHKTSIGIFICVIRTQIRTMINRILLLDQKVMHQGEIPLDVRGNLTKNSNMPNRIPKILN